MILANSEKVSRLRRNLETVTRMLETINPVLQILEQLEDPDSAGNSVSVPQPTIADEE